MSNKTKRHLDESDRRLEWTKKSKLSQDAGTREGRTENGREKRTKYGIRRVDKS